MLIDFELPPDRRRLVIRGVIANLHLLGETLVRIGVHILPSILKKGLLQRYIFSRKKEILEELDRNYLEENRYPTVVNLFF